MARLPDLQVVTYHWSEADKSMIHTPLPKCNRLDYPPSAAPTSTAAFNQLPLEILHNVLQFLDIDTARSVTLLSWTNKIILDGFPPYRALVTNASSLLSVLHSTHLASTYSIGQLYDALTNDRCTFCKAFGPYLSLTTCERCCFSCLFTLEMAPITMSSAVAALKLSRKEIEKRIPIVNTVPGVYGILRPTQRTRKLKVVSLRKALALSSEKLGIKPGQDQQIYFDQKTRKLLKYHNDVVWFMASTPIPYLNVRDSRTETGLWCRGCELAWIRRDRRSFVGNLRIVDTAYTEKEYLKHFEECEPAKQIWQLFQREGKAMEHLPGQRHREWVP